MLGFQIKGSDIGFGVENLGIVFRMGCATEGGESAREGEAASFESYCCRVHYLCAGSGGSAFFFFTRTLVTGPE